MDTSVELACLFRLGVALAGGTVLGWEREAAHKAAGIRTHAMVALGSCLFTFQAAMSRDEEAIGRAIQGIAAGVGFIGAGAILKNTAEENVRGLTTAGSIWLTAAMGSAAGCGQIGSALIAAVAGFVVLRVLPLLSLSHKRDDEVEEGSPSNA